MSLFRVTTTRHVLDGRRVPAGTPGAQKVQSRSGKWYGYVGTTKTPLHRNRAIALQMLVEKRREAESGEEGSCERERKRPIAEHVQAFIEEIRNSRRGKLGTNPCEDYVLHVESRLGQGLEGVKMPADLDRPGREAHLASLLRERDPLVVPDGEEFRLKDAASLMGITVGSLVKSARTYHLPITGPMNRRVISRGTLETLASYQYRRRGRSPVYITNIAQTLRRFSHWLTRRCGWRLDPLEDMHVGTSSGRARHHARRSLTLAEVATLLEHLPTSTRTYRGLTGRDRWAIYLTALATGFRRSEVAALTPSRFDLAGDSPCVHLSDRESKNGQGARQPVARAIAVELYPYLEGRDPHQPVWPGNWCQDAAEMLTFDLRDVGVPYVTEGPNGLLFADFHGLRHTFIAFLDRAGVTLKQAMHLARHSDPRLTMGVYGVPHQEELAESVDRIGLPIGLPMNVMKLAYNAQKGCGSCEKSTKPGKAHKARSGSDLRGENQ